MTAPTHIAGGISTMAFFSLLVPIYRLDLSHLLVGTFFSILPDIDNPRSFIGRLFFFISGPLDRKFGHRTLTHSFLFMLLISISAYLLLYIFSRSLTEYLSLTFTVLLAYFSHLFFDSMTKQGILAYYPSRLWGVFPARASWRIRTGSKKEILFFAVFIITSAVFLPLGQSGMTKAFNRLFQSNNIEVRLKEFEAKKQKAALGFTSAQIDSLLDAGAIDPKQAEELKSKLQEIDIQLEKFKQDQGVE